MYLIIIFFYTDNKFYKHKNINMFDKICPYLFYICLVGIFKPLSHIICRSNPVKPNTVQYNLSKPKILYNLNHLYSHRYKYIIYISTKPLSEFF